MFVERFFPPKGGEQSPMLRSIGTLLDWQTEASDRDATFQSFTVFLTTHVERGLISDDALEQMIVLIDENQDRYTEFADAVRGRFGITDARRIAVECFEEFYGVGLAKRIVGMANDRGWRSEITFCGRYQRTRHPTGQKYAMLSWVAKFDRLCSSGVDLGDDASSDGYKAGIKTTARKPKDVDYEVREVEIETATDLSSVVSTRAQHQTKVRSAG